MVASLVEASLGTARFSGSSVSGSGVARGQWQCRSWDVRDTGKGAELCGQIVCNRDTVGIPLDQCHEGNRSVLSRSRYGVVPRSFSLDGTYLSPPSRLRQEQQRPGLC